MDFNDIESRLKRVYITLIKRFNPHVCQNTVVTHDIKGTTHVVGFHFDEMDANEKSIVIMDVVNAIASLKDHLKNKLVAQRMKPQLVEDLINKSYELSLIIDLWNLDKHGYPLSKRPRSGTNPKIINASSGLTMTGGNQGSVTLRVSDEGATFSTATANMAIHIDGDVVDKRGNFIMSVEDLISNAILQIESFVHKHNIGSNN